MGSEDTGHRRFGVLHEEYLAQGIYDKVVDARLEKVLQLVRARGIEVGTRDLRRRDGRLLARELARVDSAAPTSVQRISRNLR